MSTDRLKAYGVGLVLDRADKRRARASRRADRWAEVGPGGPPYRLLWCQIRESSPGDPPDERYYADEVRPATPDSGGHLTWEAVPGGVQQVVIYNVAEAGRNTHLIEPGAIVRVEERLDRSGPPQMIYLMSVGGGEERLARIVSYDDGLYTVQPVRRTAGGFADEGPPIQGVPNLGELWNDEQGYLTGPAAFDRYVRIFKTPAGWAMVLHPPRLV